MDIIYITYTHYMSSIIAIVSKVYGVGKSNGIGSNCGGRKELNIGGETMRYI